MHAFQVESQAYQTPFACDRAQATQRKLTEPHDFLDDADDGFYRGLA